MKKYTVLVMANAKPGRNQELVDWYTSRHLSDVLNAPGFTSAQLLRVQSGSNVPAPTYEYAATFDIETEDLGADVAELFRRHNTPALPACDAMEDDTFFAAFEAMTPVIRK